MGELKQVQSIRSVRQPSHRDCPLEHDRRRTDVAWFAAVDAGIIVHDAVCHPECTRKHRIGGLPRVDALIVQDTDLSADPAAVLRRVNAPVALLDGVRATPHRWAYEALATIQRHDGTLGDVLPELGVLAITHYQRLLEHLEPDVVHILIDGRIVASGGSELARRLERDGYEAWKT